ncbi:MAG: NADPH:quinone oxidoreductase family protein [Deltaproteobacteria bacterium]|nr:NADPH:quinone oxidoreductase family protein [Deltaproteobacteria bacterium]
MKAVVCKQFGPPEDLVVEEVDDPVPGEGQLLIDVHAAAVTFPDTLIIEDKYQFKATPPFIPGGEVAGVVSAVGPGVTDFAVGDRVAGSGGVTGGFAERVARKLPDEAGFAESTGLLYAYGTGYYGLKYRGDLKAGETLLVLGAAGSVGMAAVELGKLMGATVIAAASREDKLTLCKERGADATINYETENLKERAKELTGGKGVDVVYDAVGGDYAEAALRAIAWNGRFLVIGFTAGIPAVPFNLALLKSCQIVGVFLGAMVGREPETRDAIERDLLKMMASGELRPHISRRYSLEEAPSALRDMLDRKLVGKVVVEP